ncbi:MAG: InlB B-repeat-containing protein, partial [Clostridia bacterium]|nr:InlB B-repeat-containing protein [Clostridia bacterium]
MIIGAVALVLILGVMLPLLVTFCGVRGVYVNVKNPREYYRFGVSSVEYYENVDDPEMMMEGKYSISGNSITFTIEDEMFGEMSDTSSFQKLDGNKKIQIGDDVYEYVGYSIGGKVTLTFDANGGEGSTEVDVEMGKKLSSLPENPTKTDYRFNGWKVSSDEYFKEYSPIWKDTVLIAEWKECNHAGMNCDE